MVYNGIVFVFLMKFSSAQLYILTITRKEVPQYDQQARSQETRTLDTRIAFVYYSFNGASAARRSFTAHTEAFPVLLRILYSFRYSFHRGRRKYRQQPLKSVL